MSDTKIKYNLQLTLLAKLSDNVEVIPKLIQDDLMKLPAHTITSRKDLEGIMAKYLSEKDTPSYDTYKDFISDSMGQIFILIDKQS